MPTAKPRKRTDLRIGPGEFRNPKAPVPAAQKLFLDAVVRLVPEVLAELGDLADARPEPAHKRRARAFARVQGLTAEGRARYEQIALDRWRTERLRAWAPTRGFSDRWLMRYARRTLTRWRARPETRGSFAPFTAGEWLPGVMALNSPAWNSRLETEADYRARVDAYIRSVSGTEYARGAVLVTAKRARSAEPATRHFEWLALKVAGRLSLSEIASRDAAVPEKSTVSRGIRNAARLAGVTLREPLQ